MLLFASVMKTERSMDWREPPFSMNVFDCTTPTMINKFHLPEDCSIPKKEKQAGMRDAWILGEEYVHEFSGVVCTATISCFRGYCGAYLHWKFMDVPEVDEEEPVTLKQCLAAKKGSYNSPDGKKLKISPGETILYQYVEDGSIILQIPTARVCPFCYIRAPFSL